MGFMQRFERSLENSTSDAFARVFGGALTPLEVEHALRRESGDKLQELPDGQLLSPNHFIVTLSPGDAQRFANDEATSRVWSAVTSTPTFMTRTGVWLVTSLWSSRSLMICAMASTG